MNWLLWLSWACVGAYGAWLSAREMWPPAIRHLRRAASLSAWNGTVVGQSVASESRRLIPPVLGACGWLLGWVVLCTAWAALLLWSGAGIWAGDPRFVALFG